MFGLFHTSGHEYVCGMTVGDTDYAEILNIYSLYNLKACRAVEMFTSNTFSTDYSL